MLKKLTETLVESIVVLGLVLSLLSAATLRAEPRTDCEPTLAACDVYVTELEKEKDTAEKLLQAQARKIELLEEEQQSWFFLCSDKVSCTLFGLFVGAVSWELAR